MKYKLITALLITALTLGIVPGITAVALDTLPSTNSENIQLGEVKNTEIMNSVTTSSAIKLEESFISDDDINNINEVLSKYRATNNTKEEDILNIIKECLSSKINVNFGADMGQAFNIIKASTGEEGNVSGTIILSDEEEHRKDIKIDLTIEKLKDEEETDTSTTSNDSSAPSPNEQENIDGKPVEVTKHKIVKLLSSIDGTAIVGNTITVKVSGYGSAGEELKLDSNKISYKWYANGKEVGDGKELSVTKELNNKYINCKVDYPDNEEGEVIE